MKKNPLDKDQIEKAIKHYEKFISERPEVVFLPEVADKYNELLECLELAKRLKKIMELEV
jgi:predicted glycosyl hydrolase (DUF1957 family)